MRCVMFNDPGDQDEDLGYSTSFPNPYGGWHRTIFDRDYRDHFSFDTDADDDYLYGSGHYTGPFGQIRGYDLPSWDPRG